MFENPSRDTELIHFKFIDTIFGFNRTDCDKLFRSSITHTEEEITWADHPDG